MANVLVSAQPIVDVPRLKVQGRSLNSNRRTHGVTTVCSSGRGAADDVFLLDYGAGNVRSVRNAVKRLGYNLREVTPGFMHASYLRVVNRMSCHRNHSGCSGPTR